MNKKKHTQLAIAAVMVGLTAGSVQAAVIAVDDISFVPDGTATTVGNATDVNAANGGNVFAPTINNTEVAYVVTTFNFGTGSLAQLNAGFASTTTATAPNRAGIRMTANTGTSTFIGGLTGSDTMGNVGGQSVTLILKLDYDINRSTTNNDDTIGFYWINPTLSSTEGSPDVQDLLANNSHNFAGFSLSISNFSTPDTAGTSSITNTTILTGADATFANALALAVIPEPSSALLGGLGFLLLLRRRR